MKLSKYHALLGWLNIVGIALMGVSLLGIITTYPLVKTFYSALHLLAVPAGFLVLLGLLAFKSNPDGRKLGGFGLVGFGLLIMGLILYMLGNFFYAVLHGILNLVSVSANIHQIPLNDSRTFLSFGFVVLALALLKWQGWNYLPAWALLLGALIFFFGYNAFILKFYWRSDPQRYLECATFIVPLVLAWIWVSYHHIVHTRSELSPNHQSD